MTDLEYQIGSHAHPHGNHEHTHIHYRTPAEHDGSIDAHGWHDGDDAPDGAVDFDDTFGEESLSERKPSGLIEPQLDKMFRWGNRGQARTHFDVKHDGETLIVVPYVPGMLQVPAWLRRRAALIDLSGSQYDYYDLMLRLFQRGDPVLIVEQDMVPTPEQVEEITTCPEPVCAISYESYQGDVVEVFGDFGALGFICFKDPERIAYIAEVLVQLGPTTWSRLDGHVYRAQLTHKDENGNDDPWRPHLHKGSVEHRHLWPEGRRPESRKRYAGAVDLTVITCTIPGRERMLLHNMESVRDQTRKVEAHVVIADDGSLGTETKYNRAAWSVETDWLALLDDDNYLFKNHIEVIEPYLADFDVVYTYAENRPHVDLSGHTQEQLLDLFNQTNVLDQSCAIRRKLFQRVGGFRVGDISPRLWTDQDLWYRLALLGARFKCVPEVTWHYGLKESV